MINIRAAVSNDADAVWSIIEPTIRAGETLALNPDLCKIEGLSYWFRAGNTVFIAERDGKAVGSYYLRVNQAGGGNHICNAGYVTAANATGKGIARHMCQHSMETARAQGFRAMQFNFVVSTNEHAVGLWQSLGFEIIGRLPLAFRHPTYDFVDALVMFRTL